MNKCEVCNEREGDAVLCVPGMPYSASYCKECAQAGANPYWCLVTNAAMCEGIGNMRPEYASLVEVTLKYLGKTWDEFNADVKKDMNEMSNYMSNCEQGDVNETEELSSTQAATPAGSKDTD